MDGETPLRRSKSALLAAGRAVEKMCEANSFMDFADAWQTLLDRLEKVWVMVERECQPFRGIFEPWQGRFTKLRKEDELLCYLHQARHADQHTTQPSVADSIGGIDVTIPQGQNVRVVIDRAKGRIGFTGGAPKIRIFGSGYILLPFRNRGVLYYPPKSHLSVELMDFSPVAVAKKGWLFYADFLKDAEERFFA